MAECSWKLRRFEGVGFNCFPTGSAIYGFDIPQDLDYVGHWDFVIEDQLKDNGWTYCGDHDEGGKYPAGAFVAYRKGFINLILVKTQFYMAAYQNSHVFLLKNPYWGTSKAKRIEVFNHFRHESTSGELQCFLDSGQENKGGPF